jgi:hypothetical protein
MANELRRIEPDEAKRLFGQSIIEARISRPHYSKLTITLALIAWLTTAGLAFMLGRASVKPEIGSVPQTTQVSKAAQAPVISRAPAPNHMPATAPAVEGNAYPRFVSSIPTGFRGAWDEIVTDKCFGREVRYKLNATTLENFEVVTDVERVKLVSPTEIEVYVTGYDSDKNQFNDKIGFRLVDGGKTLRGTWPESNYYRRCPSS